jgi:hypothetical protein
MSVRDLLLPVASKPILVIIDACYSVDKDDNISLSIEETWISNSETPTLDGSPQRDLKLTACDERHQLMFRRSDEWRSETMDIKSRMI